MLIKKAYGYIWVSTNNQIDNNSLDYQKEAIEKYCETNKIELV